MEAKEITEILENEVNCIGNYEKFVEIVLNLSLIHRTLQQSLIGKLIIPLVMKYAENYENGNYDARNEKALEFCKTMKDGLFFRYPFLNEMKNVRFPCV